MTDPFVIAVCLLFTAAIVFYVFYLPGTLKLGPPKTRVTYLRERKDVVYDNLRDLNFEYKAGKFPEADYQAMKNSLKKKRRPSSQRSPGSKALDRRRRRREPEPPRMTTIETIKANITRKAILKI